MTKEEAKKILAAYRPGDQDQLESDFAEALAETQRDAELARWFAEEREFDRTVAAHLKSVPVPFGLKTRILANMRANSVTRWRWVAAVSAAAAVLLLVALATSLSH